MGRSYTPRYALHVRATGGHHTPSAWNVKQNGKPTQDNITKYVKDLEDSCRPNGINEHLGIFSITKAWIVDQHNGNTVVVNWQRPPSPMFVVIEPLPVGHRFHCHTHGLKTLSERKV